MTIHLCSSDGYDHDISFVTAGARGDEPEGNAAAAEIVAIGDNDFTTFLR
jgi:hypothetical protein